MNDARDTRATAADSGPLPRRGTGLGLFRRNAIFLLLYALGPLIVGFLVVRFLLPLLHAR